jgi:predicted acylesterase/phospholipase RssA
MESKDPQDPKIYHINKARLILNGQSATDTQIKTLVDELQKLDQFGYASEILQRQTQSRKLQGRQVGLSMYHTLVKFVYKDQSLPSAFRFDKALKILQSNDELAVSSHCETLGLAGAIYKRKWLYDHQFKNLILSSHYYKKGFDLWQQFVETGPMPSCLSMTSGQNDMGYTGINYAYISELMAVDKLEEHGSVTGITPGISSNFDEAELARQTILVQLLAYEGSPEFAENVNKWVYPTIAEAYFGLRQYDNAAAYIRKYMDESEKTKKTSETQQDLEERLAWEVRTSRQQLLSIAYLQIFQKEAFSKDKIPHLDTEKYKPIADAIDLQKINECLHLFRKQDVTGADHTIKKDGKLGLALSGGGFRAALFHIGTLAALAEADHLKDVEVLSCVSGGSIIGAYYYVKLKKLLETKLDSEINQEDYIALIKEIEQDFLEAVQKNLRLQILTDPWKNLKMIFTRKYSRTHRVGELYDKLFYNDLVSPKPPIHLEDGSVGDQKEPLEDRIYMDELKVNPAGQPGFNLALDNWDRINKVPQLVLNATCLNTGHNWQFTASWMGEPPGTIQTEIDVKPRLRRMYYHDAPERYKRFPLGTAVGASSCVPVLFPPLLLPDLYPGIDLQLIDGGLHDNQGIGALIEQECNNMIISDASGQMPINTKATNGITGVFFRADLILQERLRELQFKDIEERNHTTQIRDLVKIHLKNGLQSKPVNWKHCTDPARKIMYNVSEKEESELTEYGVLIKVQQMLSEIRTDLDAFHDTEAYALMYSGYRQTHFRLEKDEKQDISWMPPQKWEFLRVKKGMTNPAEAEKMIAKLKFSKNVFFKVFKIMGLDKYKTPLLVSLLALLSGLAGYGVMILGNLWECFWCTVGYSVIIPTMGFILFMFVYWLYIGILAPVYNKHGKIKK